MSGAAICTFCWKENSRVPRHRNRRHETTTGRWSRRRRGVYRLSTRRDSARGGAEGILRQIELIGRELIARHGPRAIGIGFGGPVDAAAGANDHQPSSRRLEQLPAGRLVPRDIRLARCAFQRRRRRRAGRGPLRRGPRQTHCFLYHRRQRYRRGVGHRRPRLFRRPGNRLRNWPPAARPRCRRSGQCHGRINRQRLRHRHRRAGVAGNRASRRSVRRRSSGALLLSDRSTQRANGRRCRCIRQPSRTANFLPRLANARLGHRRNDRVIAPQIIVIGGGVPLAGETIFFALFARKSPATSSRRWPIPIQSSRPRWARKLLCVGRSLGQWYNFDWDCDSRIECCFPFHTFVPRSVRRQNEVQSAQNSHSIHFKWHVETGRPRCPPTLFWR